MTSTDFVDEMVAERTRSNPEFPRILQAAARRRSLAAEVASATDADTSQEPK